MNEVWVAEKGGYHVYECECGEYFGAAMARARDHLNAGCDRPKAPGFAAEPAEDPGVAALRADLEAAIEAARTEGALHALETAACIAEGEANMYASTWGEDSAGDKALLRVAAAIRARKGAR